MTDTDRHKIFDHFHEWYFLLDDAYYFRFLADYTDHILNIQSGPVEGEPLQTTFKKYQSTALMIEQVRELSIQLCEKGYIEKISNGIAYNNPVFSFTPKNPFLADLYEMEDVTFHVNNVL